MTDSDICGPDDRVARHYRALLAANYTWMLGGDIEATARDQQATLQSLVTPASGVILFAGWRTMWMWPRWRRGREA